ncbi:MAG: hypothetical protein JXR40_02620 [Pontiellaceae bacterium]|nr:hypothetical protein [Pontiellaceae bacterium]
MKKRGTILILSLLVGCAFAAEPVELHWLGGKAPAAEQIVTFGVPWPEGEQHDGYSLGVRTADGKLISTDSKPMAYWPDGSIKWTGHTILSAPEMSDIFTVVTQPRNKWMSFVKEKEDVLLVDTGALRCAIEKEGNALLRSLEVSGTLQTENLIFDSILNKEIGKNLMPVGYVQDNPSDEVLTTTTKVLAAHVTKVTVEDWGPLCAVIKVVGEYVGGFSKDGIIPFTARLYFSKGSSEIRIVYTIFYEGDEQQDYIRGLGLQMEMPLEGDLLNRHVMFAGEDDGVWHETSRLFISRPGRLEPNADQILQSQLNSQPLKDAGEYGANRADILEQIPAWDGFKLTQLSSGAFEIHKRTGTHSSWLKSDAGGRARGSVFVGDSSGGIVWGLRDFWQMYPSSIEVEGVTTDAAKVTFWLWPPEAQAMDLRHYSDQAHGLQASYEDYEEGLDTPYGVARTFEMTLRATEAVPSNEAFSAMANATAEPALLVCSPEYYHSVPVFGRWSLPDTSSESLRWVEDRLTRQLDYLIGEIDRRDWYGFWNYGDVMHQYDPVRHQWKYDLGGFAWANTELAPNVWLWYSFLRTGNAEVFRTAEAMTRHTAEVDMYHSGPLKGLGTRHNVSHWGGGAKEVRISQALFHRFYYYLTADERVGDILDSVADNEQALIRLNPLRKVAEQSDWPTQARIGPDWFALAGNWYTAWERTGNPEYLDRIKTGMDSILSLPYGLFTGPYLNYNPETGQFGLVNDEATFEGSHMASIFGGAELMFELVDQVDHPEWKAAWLDYCERYNWSKAEWVEHGFEAPGRLGSFPAWHARLSAYVGLERDRPDLLERGWQELLFTPGEPQPGIPQPVDGSAVLNPVREVSWASINQMSQWGLNAIELLEFAANAIPKEMPEEQKRP